MKTVVVIPAYQEEQSVGRVVAELVGLGYPVVVVDDGSTDATRQQAASAGAAVVRHTVNRGQGAALQTGITVALRMGADVVVTFDADGQHDPADVAKLVDALRLGAADVALGSRFAPGAARPLGMPRLRRWLLRLAVVFDRWRTGLAITDTHNGVRAFTAAAAGRLRIRQDGMAHASELLDQIAALGLRHVEVPVTVRYTDYARAKGQRNSSGFSIVRDLVLRRWM